MSVRSLVIGANSFIGSYLIRALQTSGEVTGVYNNNTDRLVTGVKNVPLHQLNEIGTDFQVVYIVSAFIHTGKMTEEGRMDTFNANVALVGNICNRFTGSRIVLCSSVSVYDVQEGPVTEKSSKGCLNEYGVSKLWSEKIVASTANFAIVRFSSVFGIGMNTRTILPLYIKQALADKEITVYGKGERLQDYIHVQDAVGYLIAAGNYQGNDEFLACASESLSNLSLAEIVAEATGSKISFKGEDRSPSFTYNNSITSHKLKYHSRITLQEDIKEIIKWIEKGS